MNRIEFMKQLESLLQNISPTEREEALQYYNDYFNDAGVENEQDVIEALGNPARVAETIKRDLYGEGYEEAVFQKPMSSDRAVVKYDAPEEEKKDEAGKAPVHHESGQNGENGSGQTGAGADGNSQTYGWTGAGAGESSQAYGRGGAGTEGSSQAYGREGAGTGGSSQGYSQAGGYGNNQSYGQSGAYGNYQGYSHSGAYGSYGSGTQVQRQKKMSTGMIVLIVLLCVLASPVLISVAGGVIGLVAGLAAGWLGLVVGFGITAIVLLVVMVCLVAAGIAGIFISPVGAMGLIGGGLVCGGIGILFLMLTVAMVGIATPAVIKWVAGLFSRKKDAA